MCASGFAHAVACAVLSRMSIDGGPPWSVLEVVPPEEEIEPPGVHHLLVTLGDASGRSDGDDVAVYFTAGPPREDAVVATASQIQDHAVEATRGVALPACPGHQHPLQARVLDRRALWVCPEDPAHHTELIVGPTGE